MEGDDWFLRRVLVMLVRKHADTIRMGRCIMKDRLYRDLSWWYRCSRASTREVLRMLVQAYPGIRFTNRGLHVPAAYVDPENWKQKSDVTERTSNDVKIQLGVQGRENLLKDAPDEIDDAGEKHNPR